MMMPSTYCSVLPLAFNYYNREDACVCDKYPGCQVGTSSGHAGAFGRGFYFSATIHLSTQFAAGDVMCEQRLAGSRALLLCKVLVGGEMFITSYIGYIHPHNLVASN